MPFVQHGYVRLLQDLVLQIVGCRHPIVGRSSFSLVSFSRAVPIFPCNPDNASKGYTNDTGPCSLNRTTKLCNALDSTPWFVDWADMGPKV